MNHGMHESNKLVDQALQLHQSGQLEEASPLYRKAITKAPNNIRALYFFGLLKHQQGDNGTALSYLTKCRSLAPNDADIHYNIGVVAQAKKDYTLATESYKKAIVCNPKYYLAYHNLGIIFNTTNKHSDAIPYLKTANTLSPDNLDSIANLCIAYIETGDYKAAIELCISTLKKAETDSRFWYYLGDAHLRMESLEIAESALLEACKYNPQSSDILNRLGELYRLLGRYDDSIGYFNRTISLYPNEIGAHRGIGKSLYYAERYQESMEHFTRAKTQFPDNLEIVNNLSFLQLLTGQYREGWKSYLSRTFERTICKKPPFPPFDKDLSGKTIVLTPEQGIGDQLFFLRFNHKIIERGATVKFAVHDKLMPVLSNAAGLGELIVTMKQIPENADIYAMGDAPYLLQIDDTNSLPSSIKLTANASKLEVIKQQLKSIGPPPYIGLTWRAGVFGLESLHKEINFSYIKDLVRQVDATWIILQRNPQKTEIDDLLALSSRAIFDASTLNDDLETMLAMLDCIDDYVTVSNTNLHLRSCLDKHGHALIPSPPEWRWGVSASESPWFPGWKTYRQRSDRNWQRAFEKLIVDLGQH